MLVNRLTPIENESLESFLDRLGIANYYDDKRRWYSDIVGIHREAHLNYLQSSITINQIASITMVEPSVISHMLVSSFQSHFINLWRLEGKGDYLELSSGNTKFSSDWLGSTAKRTKLCPLCWLEQGAIMLPWLIRFITTCPRHHIVLTDLCPHCNTHLRLDSDKCANCKEQVSPVWAESIEDSALAIRLNNITWQTIGCEPIESNLAWSFPSAANISRLNIFTFLWEMGSILIKYDPLNPMLLTLPVLGQQAPRLMLRSLRCHQIHLVFMAALETLVDWPHGWFATLHRIAEFEKTCQLPCSQSSSRISRKNSLVSGTNRLLKGKQWSWLWGITLDYISRRSQRGSNIQSWILNSGALAQKAHADVIPMISRKSAARRLNIHEHTVNRLIQTGRLTNVIQVENQSFISTSEIEQISRQYAQTIGRDDLLKWLGISRPTLRKIIGKGLLFPILNGKLPRSRELRFDLNDVQLKLQQLVGHLPISCIQTEQTEYITLHKAMCYLNQAGIDMVHLLIAIRDRHLLCFRTSSDISLVNLVLDKQKLIEYRRLKLAGGDNQVLSSWQTASFLGVAPEVLVYICKSKLLMPINLDKIDDPRHWIYQMDAVKTFQQRYVDSKGAAEVLGFSQRQVSAWARVGWLPVASGPHIDGSHLYRFERDALVRWRYDRMVSKEVREYLGISKRTLEQWVALGKLIPLRNMSRHPLWFKREDVQHLRYKKTDAPYNQ